MDAVSSPGDTSSPDEEISFDFWLPLLWFHMATWLWPIAPALQATKSQDQHQAESIFLRNNPSKASVHIQVPTRDLIGYGQNNSLQTARNSVCGYKAGLQHCWILDWVVAEVHILGMRGDTQSSHWVVGLHPLRDWVQPEMSRQLSEADGHLQGPCWERTALPAHEFTSHQASEPVEGRATRAFSAPLLSPLCFCKGLY